MTFFDSTEFNPDPECQMTDSRIISRYIHAGKGVVALVSPSGKHHTYSFKRPLNEAEFPDDMVFVYAMHWQGTCYKQFYIGTVEQGVFRLTRRSRFTQDTDIVRGAEYITKMAKSQHLCDTTPMRLYHNGRCCKCGRKLVSSKYLTEGIGKKCLSKWEEKANARTFEFIQRT